VALPRPLRLKSEKYSPTPPISQSGLNVAVVWVDAGVYHCDLRYEYLIPERLQDSIDVGVRVIVPFNGRSVEALVLERIESAATRQLKVIEKLISPIPVATRQSLSLIEKVANQWAAHPYDVIRSAIPPRVAAVEKEDWIRNTDAVTLSKVQERYLLFPPAADYLEIVVHYLKKNPIPGSRLILLPDSRSVQELSQVIPQSLILDSQLEKETRYRNFLDALHHRNRIIIGTRSAIFAPSSDLSEIIMVKESSDLYYELRSPGWNARDIAFMRAMDSSLNLTFIGYSPSVEVAQRIEQGKCQFLSKRARVDLRAFPAVNGELLPSAAMKVVREELKKGPILFVAPRKGYSQALSCAQCRNIALCPCGGKLLQRSATSSPECVICSSVFPGWRCKWCSGSKPFLLQRGAARYAVEIGKSFPNIPITESHSEKILDWYTKEDGFVVATPGALARTPNGYAAVILLEADNFLAQSDLRALERARATYFEAAGLLSTAGKLIVIGDPSNPINSALSSWKPSLITQRDLREREEVNLPPFSYLVSLEIESTESTTLYRALRSAQSNGRLPALAQIHDPVEKNSGKSRILIRVPVAEARTLISLLHEFQRRRSSSGKSLATLRINPYSIA